MKHRLNSDIECALGHIDPDDPGQCRWCNSCGRWIRPKDFDTECTNDYKQNKKGK